MAEERGPEDGGGGGGGDGVLLYYKYAPVPDIDALVRLYESNCRSLGLLGRVRVGPDGVNVTVGGKLSSLDEHIATMKSNCLFDGTDFKLACCDGPADDRISRECGFTSLSVRVVKELVTFIPHPLLKSPSISNAGKHLSAAEFHSVLHNSAGDVDSKGSVQHKQLLLLDARNLYETRIGMFQSPNAETLNPGIRQYSDLPAWIDKHSERLRNNRVLMYCTGGIRCEMASAYLRSKGAGFDNVYQLFGGIQRYLEQFPDGGFFKGKNFVFDYRVSVGSQDVTVMGSCLLCGTSFDDYSSRCRCTYCRMLVLVCKDCKKSSSVYVCELCQRHRSECDPRPSMGDDELLSELSSDLSGPSSMPRFLSSCSTLGQWKLRILCLHGFRQNALGFKGRTASLAKKLKDIAELVYVDAPHEVPFIYQPRSTGDIDETTCSTQQPPPSWSCKKKFAWLVSPTSSSCLEGPGWEMANQPFDPLQYKEQTGGFNESYAFLKEFCSRMGPFDGILGFSQGQFAVLCSGFSLLPYQRSIRCPSLHVYGSSKGRDRQVACQVSIELVGKFDQGCSVVVEHDMGHIIPTQAPYIDQIRDFLRQFLHKPFQCFKGHIDPCIIS
ncbi:unnamed protein product [Spirodela intermedia]|uniref:Rhodanese domain-containing protein n=1 Tax=Spirodela intermedia TaxID=51605 RepID=A0A7I8I8B7_SPIIN|nr:unnamed protein product [Spirodela intermedia]CAA6653875.1 unnamed protein product [Spirodela intermedia]